jgi:prevent-host-death family protein
MRTIEINDARSRLDELIDSASAGEEIVITKGQTPVARLTSANHRPSLREIRPTSVGAVLKPFSADDDLLEEMTDR